MSSPRAVTSQRPDHPPLTTPPSSLHFKPEIAAVTWVSAEVKSSSLSLVKHAGSCSLGTMLRHRVVASCLLVLAVFAAPACTTAGTSDAASTPTPSESDLTECAEDTQFRIRRWNEIAAGWVAAYERRVPDSMPLFEEVLGHQVDGLERIAVRCGDSPFPFVQLAAAYERKLYGIELATKAVNGAGQLEDLGLQNIEAGNTMAAAVVCQFSAPYASALGC